MQHCVASPLRVLLCFLVAVASSTLIKRQNPQGNVSAVSYRTLAFPDVEYAKGLTGCTKGVLADDRGTCAEMSLLLDIFTPNGTTITVNGTRRPAVLIVHGGANAYGSKNGFNEMASANFWAEHGYVAFVPNYRLLSDAGTYPGDDFIVGLSSWSSLYPAVRDVKASLRYIIANADTLGVDTSRIVTLGSSAGGMDILAAFSPHINGQFTTELSLAQDPTLSTVNADVHANVQAIILKWGASWGINSYSVYADGAASAAGERCPVMQFHGTEDAIIPFEHAVNTSRDLDAAGVQNCLHVMENGSHANFGYGCTERGKEIYCDVIDQMALNFVRSAEASADGRVTCPAVPTGK